MSAQKQSTRVRVGYPDTTPAFDAGHLDGFADATNGNPRDPSLRFKAWHQRRAPGEFTDYERGYHASYDQAAMLAGKVEG